MSEDTTFRFRCYHTLKRNLGKVDSITECTELAVCEFVTNALSFGDPTGYVRTLSEKHGIKVDNVDPVALHTRVSQLHILAVYQQAEEFLESFRDEHPAARSWTYSSGDTLLNRILKNLGDDIRTVHRQVGVLEIDLFDYYHQIRNRFMHTEISEKRLNSRVEDLQCAVQSSEEYGKLKAPNSYREMSFDDFILFTRVTKHIAQRFCQLGKPTNGQILQMVESLDGIKDSGVDLRHLRRYKNKPGRLRKALTTLLRSLYSLGTEESEPVVELLMSGPLA
jgi:hypothetical protein